MIRNFCKENVKVSYKEDANIEFGKDPKDTKIYNKSGKKEINLSSGDKQSLIDVLRVGMKAGVKLNEFNINTFDIQIFSNEDKLSEIILTSDDGKLTRNWNLSDKVGVSEFNKIFGTYAYQLLLEISKKGGKSESKRIPFSVNFRKENKFTSQLKSKNRNKFKRETSNNVSTKTTSLPKGFNSIASQMNSQTKDKTKIESDKGIAKTINLSQDERDAISKLIKTAMKTDKDNEILNEISAKL